MENNLKEAREKGILCEVYAGTLRLEESGETILPDSMADAEAVLLLDATPRIERKFVGEKGLEIEGTVEFSLLLSAEGNLLQVLTHRLPFEGRAEYRDGKPDAELKVVPTMEYATARLLNPRRVSLRCQVNADVRVWEARRLRPEIIGAETVEDDQALRRLSLPVKTAAPLSVEERGVTAAQDLELDSACPQIQEILLSRLTLLPGEIKVRDGEAEVTSQAVLNCLYGTPEGNYYSLERKFPIRHLMPVGEEEKEWTARATPGTVSVKAAANSYGEMKILEVDFAYDLTLEGMGNAEAEAVRDIYSTEYECEEEEGEVGVTVFKRRYGTGLSVNASAPRTEVGGEKVKSIFTGRVSLKNTGVRYDGEKGKLLAEGKAEISLVGENDVLVENEKLFSPISFEYPFQCELDAGEELTDADLMPEFTVSDLRFRADAQNLYADFEVGVAVCATEKRPTKVLTALKLNKNAKVERNTAPLTLCYPSGEESLWEIAKYYKIPVESIMEANGMTDENLAGRKVLLIPKNRPSRPVFSGIL